MRKLITLTIVVALLSVMLASPVTATRFDPKNPSWALHRLDKTNDSGDDHGADVPVDSPPPPKNIVPTTLFTFNFHPSFSIIFIDFIIDVVFNYDAENDDTTDCDNIQRRQGANLQ